MSSRLSIRAQLVDPLWKFRNWFVHIRGGRGGETHHDHIMDWLDQVSDGDAPSDGTLADDESSVSIFDLPRSRSPPILLHPVPYRAPVVVCVVCTVTW